MPCTVASRDLLSYLSVTVTSFEFWQTKISDSLHCRPLLTMSCEEIKLREAKPQDADLLSELAATTFSDSFGAKNTQDDMAKYIEEKCSVARIRAELSDPHNTFFVVFTHGSTSPCGYAKLRTSSSEECVTGPNPIELERLYVDKSIVRCGLGSRLLQKCIDHGASSDYHTMWLGVWDQNARAIAFYKRWGFQTVGSHVFTLGSDDQNDLIMQRSIA